MIPYGAVFGLDAAGIHDVAGALHCVFCVIIPPYAVYGGIYFIQRVTEINSVFRVESHQSWYQ